MAQAANEKATAQDGPLPPYSKWHIDTTIYDESMNVVDSFEDTQELWLSPPNIAVRRTRELPDGRRVQYEDRGRINEAFQISGRTGFGGKYSGQLFPTGWVHTQGSEGAASFHMVNTPLGEGHQCCLRIIDVREPVPFLTADNLEPGRYYVTTDDHLLSASDEVPEEMKKPLVS